MSVLSSNRIARDLAVEKSLDAAMEIDEVLSGDRDGAPSLKTLFPSFHGTSDHPAFNRKSLLSDSRTASLYRRAAAASGKVFTSLDDLAAGLESLTKIDADNLKGLDPEDLRFLRNFCLGLNRELITEAYSRATRPALSAANRERPA